MRQAFSLGLIAFLLVLSYFSVRLGLADLHTANPRHEMERWSKNNKIPKLLEWKSSLDAMRTAHELDPRDPGITEDMGRLYERAAATMPATSAVAFHEQALDFFRRAARQRPTSGYTWSNVALVKGRLGKIDDEYAHALKAAAALGPWEPDVLLTITETGLANWGRLSAELRELVRQDIARAMTWLPADVIRIAQRHKQIAVVCSLKERSKEAIAVCNG